MEFTDAMAGPCGCTDELEFRYGPATAMGFRFMS